ncbi:MAG TPA: HAD family hydrolase [Oligoflexus sp.]|uniref:HAD family hydrolase n=1 Tax=Oligoflexus sp. TaxID=1971216 RepID=UPI002D28BEE6|nr:HAD family hydrolase [Oligoflexus sp.]HYX33215.1 HAD family hydrolase [Oligoflexus sp.]
MNLILDLDDTIIPSSRLYEQALEKTLGGDKLWKETYLAARQQVKTTLPSGHVAARNRLLYFKRYLELRLDHERSAIDLYDQYEHDLGSAIQEWSRVHGRFDLLCELSERMPLYLLTNENTRTQLAKLHAMTEGRLSIFTGILTSEEVGVEKPHSYIFHTLLRRFGIAVEESVMVGDSFQNDILPARNLGMRALMTHEFIRGFDPEGPGLNSLSELLELGEL